jgi:ADP-ribosylglycohydrolase
MSSAPPSGIRARLEARKAQSTADDDRPSTEAREEAEKRLAGAAARRGDLLEAKRDRALATRPNSHSAGRSVGAEAAAGRQSRATPKSVGVELTSGSDGKQELDIDVAEGSIAPQGSALLDREEADLCDLDEGGRYAGVVHVGAKLLQLVGEGPGGTSSAVSKDMDDFVSENTANARRVTFLQRARDDEELAEIWKRAAKDSDPPSEPVLVRDRFGPFSAVGDRCVGVVLGTCCGDVLGANLEFRSKAFIKERWGFVRNFKHSQERKFGTFTDDTEMTAALLSSVIENRGSVDAEHVGYRSAAYACTPPVRGYGPGVVRVLERIHRRQIRPTESGREVFPDGSWANGSLMRISVLGLLHRNSPADDFLSLRTAVNEALLCTHVHEESIDAGFLCAYAAGALSGQALQKNPHTSRVGSDESFSSDDDLLAAEESGKESACRSIVIVEPLVRAMIDLSQDVRVTRKLQTVMKAHAEGWTDDRTLSNLIEDTPYGSDFAIRSSDALGVVMWFLLKCGHDPEACLTRAVNQGGDADTIGAVVGALLGAWHGTDWIPRRWWANVEDGSPLGLTSLVNLAIEFSEFVSG